MADFNTAFSKLGKIEGGYVNDKDDNGGETYKGISRKYNPDCYMWVYIDYIKNSNKDITDKEINKLLDKNINIIKEIKEIYKIKYWDILCLDRLNSQAIAEEIFDTAVNCGVKNAVKIAQKTLGIPSTGKFSQDLFNKINNYGK